MTTRATGIALAFVTAIVSGVSIFVNAHAVKHFGDATVYTTAKNAVAGILLVILVLTTQRSTGSTPVAAPAKRGRWLALVGVAVIGGSVPFVLFFEGLARAEATQAAFIQKTLVVWVSLLAVPLLKERFRAPHALAIALLLVGQAWLAGRAGNVAFGSGEAMILGATLLWSIEIVLVKHLLAALTPRTLAAARMGFGTVLLVGWVAFSGKTGQLTRLDVEQWRWVVLTGLLLTAYVATWYAALARAQAVDVTAVLVFGVVVTALLSGAADGTPINATGTILVAAGSALIAVFALRRPLFELDRFVTDTAGALLFARYAYPPNALGLCGADSPRTLLEYGDAHACDGGLAELARTFDGAWPYLTLIAGANGIADALDPRVVEAYWVGNELLDRVRPGELARHVDERFRGRIGRARDHVFGVVAAGAVPHHCFHVFAVYPWLGLLRTGVVDQPLHILDQCRTTPAVVCSVDGDSLEVLARPLLWDAKDAVLRLGDATIRNVRWRAEGLAFVPRPSPGEHVSLHWDFVCDVLTPSAARALAQATDRALRAVNRQAVAAAMFA